MGALTTSLAAFVCTGAATFLWFSRARQVAIPDDRTLFLSLWTLGVVIGLLALAQGPGWFGGTLASLAVLGGGGILVLNYLAPQRTDGAIEVGQKIPSFQALDENGETFDTAGLEGSRVLIKFFRGHW